MNLFEIPIEEKSVSAKFIKEIEVIDPDTNLPVQVSLYKEETGGIFGVDSSYIEQEIDYVMSPFNNGIINIEE